MADNRPGIFEIEKKVPSLDETLSELGRALQHAENMLGKNRPQGPTNATLGTRP